MPNPIINAMGKEPETPAGLQSMLVSFQQFRDGFKGDPQQTVQALLSSGRMTQQQYNELSQMAQNLLRFIR